MASIPQPLRTRQGRLPALIFDAKRVALQLQRAIADCRSGIKVARRDGESDDRWTTVIAEQRSALWTEESLAERRLQLGKVQNLRAAIRRLDGAVLPAGTLFSFWRQVGPPTARRGFAVGRELREGCLIPAVGGGICQLSNALYAAASDAGAEIVERHAHSQTVPGSAAAAGRDATVAYNYVDLRFRVKTQTCIRTWMTADELVVQFRAAQPVPVSPPSRSPTRGARLELLTPTLGSCVSCGDVRCARHVEPPTETSEGTGTAYLLAGRRPEVQDWLRAVSHAEDALFVPLDGAKWRLERYRWETGGYRRVYAATVVTLWAALAGRLQRGVAPAQVRVRQNRNDAALARAYARQLRPQDTHLVVDQDLLPTLRREGALGGRTFDVIAHRPPLEALQSELDAALRRWPESGTLGDYRATRAQVRAEAEALAVARRIVVWHPELSARFGERALDMGNTERPVVTPHRPTMGSVVVYVGPTLGRRGCYEVRAAALQMGFTLRVVGRDLEGGDFWAGTDLNQPAQDALEDVAVVLALPIWEARPHPLVRRALAAGVPVIATPGAGLGEAAGVTTVASGDVKGLVAALSRLLKPATIQ